MRLDKMIVYFDLVIQRSIELGTDLRFLDERLTFDFAYYKTNTRNQILSLPAVIESGAKRN